MGRAQLRCRSRRYSTPVLLFTGAALAPLAVAVPMANDDFYTPDSTRLEVRDSEGILVNDRGSDPLQVILITDTVDNGSVSVYGDGSFNYTPDYGASTNDTFRYRMRDASGGTSEATVTIDLESTLPTAVNDNYTVNATTYNVNAGSGILTNDTGGIGELSTILITDTVDNGSLSVFGGGNFTYTPDYGADTNDSFTYRMRDELGRTSEATVTLDLESTLPTAVNDNYTVNATTYNVNAGSGILTNDTGGIGELSTILITDTVDNGSLSVFGGGNFTYTPDYGADTNDSFTYRMRDELGRTSEATVTLDLESTLPTAVNDNYTLNATSLTVDVGTGILSNDTGGIGDLSAILITDTVDNGTLSVFGGGNFTFTPDYGADTNDSFTYRMRDELGRTSEATVTLDLESTLPTAVNDSYTLNATSLTVDVGTGILSNDTGGIGDLSAILITDTVDNGTLSVFGGGNFTFTPDYGADTNDSFTYRMRDELGRTSEATVILDLESTLPVTMDDLLVAAIDEVLRFNVDELLANDRGGLGGLTFLEFDELFSGDLDELGNGWYTYTPEDGFNGLVEVGYSVIDGLGRIGSSVLGFQIGDSAPKPVPVPGTVYLLLAGLAMIRLRRRR